MVSICERGGDMDARIRGHDARAIADLQCVDGYNPPGHLPLLHKAS
jgi:hypothetical protein